MTFPISPLKKLPSAASSTDKTILGPKLTELIDGSNDLDARIKALIDRVKALESAPEPGPTPPPDTTPDPGPTPSTDIEKILALVGPTKTVAETAALGPAFAAYDAKFDQLIAVIESGAPEKWEDNYYDRGKVYYARHARTGDPKWLTRANAITLKYRDEYLVPNAYQASPHWSLVRGLEIHHRLTGDEVSRTAVAGMFGAHYGYTIPRDGRPKAPIADTGIGDMENRIQARVLHAALSSYRMQATYTRPDGWGGTFGPDRWPTILREILNAILSTQNADGSWSWFHICGGQLNYMVGLLNDVLIEYFRDFEADPRIPTAIEKANEFLWSTQWHAADQAFKYCSVICNPNWNGTAVGGHEPAGDLNGLFLASFGWLRQHTGDAKWRTRGDEILTGLVRHAQPYSKQFNQAFAESYRYLGWR